MINITEGGVTAAKGFRAAGIAAGIKEEGRPDLMMITSPVPCAAAGTFTANVVKGAPVRWDMERIAHNCAAQAVLVNAGIANACTGSQGMSYCEMIADTIAQELVISPESVYLASTGLVGEELPVGRITDAVPKLADLLDHSLRAGTDAARAIMTTDKAVKQVAVNFTLEDGTMATLGACAKGSGRVHPNMCTMLALITTDLGISRELLAEALREDVADTFNMISIDGDTSTNDTVLLLSNGLAGNRTITERDRDYEMFTLVLHEVNLMLAKMIAQDGEGAAKLLTCSVQHAPDKESARKIARAVVSSHRVKEAVAGLDPRWGGVLAAMGASGAAFDPDHADILIESRAGRLMLARQSARTDFKLAEAQRILAESEVAVRVDLGSGAAEATAFGMC